MKKNYLYELNRNLFVENEFVPYNVIDIFPQPLHKEVGLNWSKQTNPKHIPQKYSPNKLIHLQISIDSNAPTWPGSVMNKKKASSDSILSTSTVYLAMFILNKVS